ncbi:MAG: alpha/beta hydrolase [Pseudomonadota bacterium]|nr:alpha/beta hydrolase [Pseudomonadota bacterium]
MRTGWLCLAVLLFAPAFIGCALTENAAAAQPQASAQSNADSEQEKAWTIGVWRPPSGTRQTPIWPNGAPGADGKSQPAERVLTARTPEALEGDVSQAVFDVSDPTITIFPPQGENTGAAVIVFPGGGFKAVVITLEGTEICNWIASKGVTCVLSKYRVPKSNHHWDDECKCAITPDPPTALQDAQRTIRLVRSMAPELDVDPHKIGVMGFSAGGYLVAQTSNIFEPAYEPVDRIDEISSRPDFAISFFPGHLCRAGDALDPGIQVTGRTPPTFLLQAWDDPVDDICNATVYARALDAAGVEAEVHLFATGGHAFGLRRNRSPDTVWPSLLENWLKDIGVL